MSAHLLKKGFTLIELLIVIAVLGILAVAVLSAINPIEQINRSKDTGSRSDAEQLISAIDRYYTTKGFYPWVSASTDAYARAWLTVNNQWMDNAVPAVSVLSKLSTGGTAEIKSSYVTRITGASANPLKVYNRGTQGDSTYICFLPTSGAFLTEAETRCGVAGAGLPADLFPIQATVCPGGNPKVYYSCLP